MKRPEAQALVLKHLSEPDREIFKSLTVALADTTKITQVEFTEGAEQLTELLDRNDLQIIGKPKRNTEGPPSMEMFVLHKGKEIT